jgi:serine/threonine protein kinase
MEMIELYNNKGKKLEVLGNGNSGEIYFVDNGENHYPRRIAYKTIKTEYKLSGDIQGYFLDECKTWFETNNPYIARAFDVEMIGGFPFIAMPCYDSDLTTVMLNNKMSYEQALVMSCQLAKALIIIREFGIVQHQDFNPQNVLIQDISNKYHNYSPGNFVNLDTKIADFGLANLRQKLGPTEGSRGGKIAFKAPEQHEPKKYDGYEPDIFALGVIMYMMFAGKHPNGDSTESVFKKSNSGKWAFSDLKWAFGNPIITLHNRKVENLINRTFRENPNERPKPEELFVILMAELHIADKITHANLELKFRFYDGFASAGKQWLTKLEGLEKIARLPGKRGEVVSQLQQQADYQKNNLHNSTDVVHYIEILRRKIKFTNSSEVNREKIADEVKFVIELIRIWQGKLHYADYASGFLINVEDYFAYHDPSYNLVGDYMSWALNNLAKWMSVAEIEKYISGLNDKMISSLFHFHLAETSDTSDAISHLEKSKILTPNEGAIYFRHYRLIEDLIRFEKNIANKASLIADANEALKQAQALLPNWSLVKDASPLFCK